jgi:hypothetical protein
VRLVRVGDGRAVWIVIYPCVMAVSLCIIARERVFATDITKGGDINSFTFAMMATTRFFMVSIASLLD